MNAEQLHDAIGALPLDLIAPAEAAPLEEPRQEESASQTAADEGGANSACYGTAVPEVAITGDVTSRTLTPEERQALARLLSELTYLPEEVCECIAEITVTVNGENKFFINLEEGFVRCSQGQAKLTREQIDTLREILSPAQ